MARLRFAFHAERDLVEIGDFIARDSPPNAARFIAQLEEFCRFLASRPLAGRVRDELSTGLRSFTYGRYVIFYRVIDDGVEIVRVLHGARDLRRAIGEVP